MDVFIFWIFFGFVIGKICRGIARYTPIAARSSPKGGNSLSAPSGVRKIRYGRSRPCAYLGTNIGYRPKPAVTQIFTLL